MTPPGSPIVVNGWSLFAHPLFLGQVETLASQVSRLKEKSPGDYKRKNATKRLAAIHRLAFAVIPEDPTRPEYRLGGTLGEERKHWFRAKFFQQYRLFFRFHKEAGIIVYAWVNDDRTKRAYNSRSDAYLVFRKMLDAGNPPESWNDLLKEARQASPSLNNIR